MAIVPSAFRASRTAHWASTVGMTGRYEARNRRARMAIDGAQIDRGNLPTRGRRRSAKSAARESPGDFAEGSRLERGESVKSRRRTDHLPKRGDDGTTSVSQAYASDHAGNLEAQIEDMKRIITSLRIQFADMREQRDNGRAGLS